MTKIEMTKKVKLAAILALFVALAMIFTVSPALAESGSGGKITVNGVDVTSEYVADPAELNGNIVIRSMVIGQELNEALVDSYIEANLDEAKDGVNVSIIFQGYGPPQVTYQCTVNVTVADPPDSTGSTDSDESQENTNDAPDCGKILVNGEDVTHDYVASCDDLEADIVIRSMVIGQQLNPALVDRYIRVNLENAEQGIGVSVIFRGWGAPTVSYHCKTTATVVDP